MATGRSRKSSVKKTKLRQKLLAALRRKPKRDLQMETLEDRQLLAGAQLIGIQSNDGDLLQDGDILNVSPSDLTFNFDQFQIIAESSLKDVNAPNDPNDADPSTIDPNDNVRGIQITRSNLDGTFAPASVSHDFGTGGAVELEFSAVRLGQDQNGIALTITKSDRGGPTPPGVSVIGLWDAIPATQEYWIREVGPHRIGVFSLMAMPVAV